MQQRWDKAEMDMGVKGVKGASPQKRGGTLVVCPTIALKQWQSELARFVKPGILKVVIHHGPNRATLAEVCLKVGRGYRDKERLRESRMICCLWRLRVRCLVRSII